MKRFLLTLLLSAALCAEAAAVPAIKTPVRRTLPDGSEITIRVYGDEFFNYTTTSDDYNIVEGDDGFYYYAELRGSELKRTATRAKDPDRRSSADRTALRSIARGVPESIATAAATRARRTAEATAPQKVGEMQDRTGRMKTLVILVSFSDNDFTVSNPADAFHDLLNEDGYSRNGSTGSAWNYYYENSDGQFDPQFVVVGPYKLDKPMSYYGTPKGSSSDEWPAQMAADACLLADPDVDFSEFANPNGVIRDVFIFYAGVNEAEGASKETVWPHRWSIYQTNVSSGTKTVFDGVQLANYACSSELRGANPELKDPDSMIANIGTFCHEFGHVLGWCDYYNTNTGSSADRNTVTLDVLSIMCGGNYLNQSRTPPAVSAFDRYLVGWLTPETIISSGTYTLGTLDKSNKAYKIDTDTEGEYFIIENRNNNYKWDMYMTGEGSGYNNTQATVDGMLIYHIDRSQNYINLWLSNGPNTSSAHECMKVVRPDGTSKLVKNWFYTAATSSISSTVVKEYVCWSGFSNGFTLSGLQFDADKTLTFTATAEKQGSLSGKVTAMNGSPIEGAQVSLYKARKSQARGLGVVSRTETTSTYSAITAADGSYSLEGVEAGIYEMSVSSADYDDYKANVTVYPINNIANVKLLKREVEQNLTRVSYHTDNYSGIGGDNGTTIWVGSIFGVGDLPVNAQGARLAGADIYLRAGATVTARVFKDGQAVGSAVDLGTTTGAQWLYADFTSLGISITDNSEVKVAFLVSNYEIGSYPIAIDNGPVTDGRGNIYSFDGTTWQSFNGSNFIIGAYFAFTDAESVSIDSAPLNIFVGDTHVLAYTPYPVGSVALIDWTSVDNDVATVENGVLVGLKAGSTTLSGKYNDSTESVAVTVTPELENITSDMEPYTFETALTWKANAARDQWVVGYNRLPDGVRRTVVTDKPEVVLNGLLPESRYHLIIGGVRTYNTGEYWGMSELEIETGRPVWTEKLVVNITDTTLYSGCKLILTAIYTPERVYDYEAQWSTSDARVATVDSQGVVTTVAGGEATISVKTRKGTDDAVKAECKVTVIEGLGDIMVEYGQNDAYLSWENSTHTGGWRVEYGQKIMYVPVSSEQTEKHFYVDGLSAATVYKFSVTAILEGGIDATTRSKEVTMLETTGTFSKLCDIKGAYTAGEDIVLRTGNIAERIERIDWTVDGTAVTPPKIKLTAGQHTIAATVTMANGKVQKLIKYVTVK